MGTADRQPHQLAALQKSWRNDTGRMRRAPPSLVFAVLGQARADGAISPEAESVVLGDLLREWALRSTLDTTELCAAQARGKRGPTSPAPVVYPAQAVI